MDTARRLAWQATFLRAHFKPSLPWNDELKRQPTKDNNNELQPQQNLGQQRAILEKSISRSQDNKAPWVCFNLTKLQTAYLPFVVALVWRISSRVLSQLFCRENWTKTTPPLFTISQVIVSNFSIYIFYYLHHWVPQMKSKTIYNLVFFTFTYISTDFTGLHQTVKIRQRWSNLLRIDQEQTTNHQQCFTISALFKQKLIPVWIHPYGTWHFYGILTLCLSLYWKTKFNLPEEDFANKGHICMSEKNQTNRYIIRTLSEFTYD